MPDTPISSTTETTFGYTGSIQYGTIAATGTYEITAYGAEGGAALYYGVLGGLAGAVGGDITLQAGAVLEIVVGGNGASTQDGGGGGGGSFVIETFDGAEPVNIIEAVAGGGGGASVFGTGGAGGPTTYVPGSGQSPAGGVGGLASGGGGFTGGTNGNPGSVNGTSFSGGAGPSGGAGGFGGGGGSGYGTGGGGGGYVGGNGAFAFNSGGQGGSSYFNGTPNFVSSPTSQPAEVIVEPLCYLRGTRILTPTGEVPVEDLRIGDPVATLTRGTQAIRWIGAGQQLVPAGHRSPATPVIVRRDALAPGVPNRDLHLTKGHALYICGAFIPAEFLVNHRSIVWDDAAREVEYYHIVLNSHEVMLAQGAPCESHRDEGNRWMFANANPAWDRPGVAPHAPVLTGGAKLDSIWARLLERSGHRLNQPTTQDPDLHLLVNGVRVQSVSQDGETFVFPLPENVRSLVIASRAAAQDELGRFRDPRRLGVAISRIAFFCDGACRLALGAAELNAPGLHGYEPLEDCTWTDGHAVLPNTMYAGLGANVLHVHLLHTTHYAAEEQQGRLAA
jgi:hypothetical protein